MAEAFICRRGGGVDTSEVDAIASDVLAPKKIVDANGNVITGTLALTGNAAAGDVIKGKTFYSTNPKSKVTGTLALTGNITAADIRSGKTGYSTNPKSKITGTMPQQGGSTTVPGTANKTAVAANRYVTGNIVVSGDANLKAANIKKNVTIFGVKGTFEGWVPVATDLYYNGQNPAGLASDDVAFENTRINLKYSFAKLMFTKTHNVRSFSKLNLKGDIGWTKDALEISLLDANDNDIITYEKFDGWTNCALDISQLTSISSGWSLYFRNAYTGTERNHYINHIWFS